MWRRFVSGCGPASMPRPMRYGLAAGVDSHQSIGSFAIQSTVEADGLEMHRQPGIQSVHDPDFLGRPPRPTRNTHHHESKTLGKHFDSAFAVARRRSRNVTCSEPIAVGHLRGCFPTEHRLSFEGKTCAQVGTGESMSAITTVQTAPGLCCIWDVRDVPPMYCVIDKMTSKPISPQFRYHCDAFRWREQFFQSLISYDDVRYSIRCKP